MCALRARMLRFGPKKFAEPVSLSSTASVDFPLPGTALGLGFDLLALCARRKRQSNVLAKWVKGLENDVPAICGNFFFQHFHSRFCSLWTALWIGGAADPGGTKRRSNSAGSTVEHLNAFAILVP
jgi:hypothetical protein